MVSRAPNLSAVLARPSSFLARIDSDLPAGVRGRLSGRVLTALRALGVPAGHAMAVAGERGGRGAFVVASGAVGAVDGGRVEVMADGARYE
jgi:hypothetical protein